MQVDKIMAKLLRGEPVELTSSDPAVVEVRGILTGDCVWSEWDLGGMVYWSPGGATAIIHPPMISR